MGKKWTLKQRLALSKAHRVPHNTPKRRIDKNGYVFLYEPLHPMANSGGYIMEHRKVMAVSLGRMLLRTELVHHQNHIKTDNRLANLALVDRKQHRLIHADKAWRKEQSKKIKAIRKVKFWSTRKTEAPF